MKSFGNIMLKLLGVILIIVWTILFWTNWNDPKERKDFYKVFKFLNKGDDF